jgi:hypothetical protein
MEQFMPPRIKDVRRLRPNTLLPHYRCSLHRDSPRVQRPDRLPLILFGGRGRVRPGPFHAFSRAIRRNQFRRPNAFNVLFDVIV